MVDRKLEFLEALKWLMEEYDVTIETLYDYHSYDGSYSYSIDIGIGRGYVNIPSDYIDADDIEQIIKGLRNDK